MTFTSLSFLFFFLPTVLVLYYCLSFSRTLQNLFLFLASIFFYAWGQLAYVPILLLSIGINTFTGWLISINKGKHPQQQLFLLLAILCNVGMLFYYKYFGFAMDTLTMLGFQNLPSATPALPIGISFFTFQAISYNVDIYTERAEVIRNPFVTGLYIAFFPTLLAGPIIRFSTVREQLYQRKSNLKRFSTGCCRFIVGLAKKMILSASVAVIADHAFSLTQGGTLSFLMAWLGIIAYILQLYFDFSGYSDMAIGLGRMFGFTFAENFNYPYISTSVSEFWRRWHISLSTWFKEYIYFPLGGSRVKNKDIMVRNLLIVWALTGIWHGANWNFLYWGLFNFVFLFLERLFHFENLHIPRFFKHIYLLLVIMLGFVLFRSSDLQQAGLYYRSMMNIKTLFYTPDVLFFLKEYGVYLILAILFATPIAKYCNHYMAVDKDKMAIVLNITYPIVMLLLFLVTMLYIMRGSYTSFIYFNF